LKNARIVAIAVVVSMTLVLGCSAEAEPEEEVAESSEGLTGLCSEASFDRCVDGGGGGGCAMHCAAFGSPGATDRCQKAVAACLQGGGGKPCKSRCGTANPSSVCSDQDEWTIIATKKCGIVVPVPPRFKVFPGKAKATCTYRVCAGQARQLVSCSEWGVGRKIQCTEGVPIDPAGNPY